MVFNKINKSKFFKKRKHKSTNIEDIMCNLLTNCKFAFKREFLIGNYPVDFYLTDYRLSIQVDGCWHHGCKQCTKELKCPRHIFQRNRDKACILFHKYQNINILRVKECTLVKDIELVKQTILDIIKEIESGKLIIREI